MLHIPGRLAVFICLAALWLGGPVALRSETPSAPRPLTGQEIIVLGQVLLAQVRLDEAETLYKALLHSGHETEFRLEAAFQLGQIHLARGQFRQAALYFNDILNLRPDLPRVRLELARAYFLDRSYQEAAFQFELVKGGDLPPEVQAKVDAFLEAIRRQKDWTVSFYLNPVADSNLNQASGGQEECIDIGIILCRPLEEKTSGLGFSANATADYFWRVNQDWGLKATLGFYGTAYEDDDFDDYYHYAALGPRYLWESGEASLQPTIQKRWFGGREYSDEYGLRLDARRTYSRLIMNGGAAASTPHYADPYVHSVLKGWRWNAYLQPRYILTDRTFIQPGLSFLREEAEERAYANDNWRYALGAYHAFPYGLSLFVEGSLTDTRYKASQWYVTRDNRIDETMRKDQTWQVLNSVSSNVFEEYNLTPVLQYTYTRRDSNIWTREYERHRVNLLFNYRL